MIRILTSFSLLLVLFVGPVTVRGQQLQSSDWIPLVTSLRQYIVVRGTVNGHETNIMLDSGAEISLIERSFAKRIGVKKGQRMNLRGVGGKTKIYRAKNVAISSGGFSIAAANIAIVDLSAMAVAIGQPVPVILGAEVFGEFVVDVDYPRQQIAFRSAESYQYDGTGVTVAVKSVEKGRYAIAASSDGHLPGWYLIDTGSDATASIFPEFAGQQGLLKQSEMHSQWVSGGVGGITRHTTASVKSFSFGGFELQDMPFTVASDDSGTPARKNFAGLLGNEVLGRFRVIFDYSREQLHLQPGPQWQTREFQRNLMGLAALPNKGKLKVLFVAPASPAELAGWREGMSISAVNGESGSASELRAKLRELSKAPPGTGINIVDDKGIARDVILARYY